MTEREVVVPNSASDQRAQILMDTNHNIVPARNQTDKSEPRI